MNAPRCTLDGSSARGLTAKSFPPRARAASGLSTSDTAIARRPSTDIRDAELEGKGHKPCALADHVLGIELQCASCYPSCYPYRGDAWDNIANLLILLARPERFELPTPRFVV